jgi:hypothetical protein
MKRLGIALALIAGAVVFYLVAYPSLTLRYRLTLEAQVDGEPRIGSGVIEVTYSKIIQLWGTTDLGIGVRGEAVVLDLGSHGMLFALLAAGTDSRSIPESIILRAYDFDGGAYPGHSVEEGQEQLRRLSGKRELPLDSLPMLVRFRNLNDPMTVERVDPLDIGKSFGAEAKLVRATLEIVSAGTWPLSSFGITGEPMTTGIDRRLLWLPRLNGGYLDGGFTSRGTPLGLYGGNFKRG